MDEIRSLLKTIRGVSRTNPVTNLQLSEIIRMLWRDIHDDNVTENIVQAAHGFVVGQAVKINSSGTWILAQADELANARCIGLVCRVVNADTFWVRRAGVLPGEYTPGADYYLSTTSAGALFIQADPEEWLDTDIREYIGTGDVDGNLVIGIDRVGGEDKWGTGARATGTDAGYFGEKTLTDDYAYICVTGGIVGDAIWKKIVLLHT